MVAAFGNPVGTRLAALGPEAGAGTVVAGADLLGDDVGRGVAVEAGGVPADPGAAVEASPDGGTELGDGGVEGAAEDDAEDEAGDDPADAEEDAAASFSRSGASAPQPLVP